MKRGEVYRDWCNTGKLVYVAEVAGEVVGTASAIIERKLMRNTGIVMHVEDVAVCRHAQKHGIGAKLMKRLEEIAREHGAYKIILNCSDEVAPFYGCCGYHQASRQMRLDTGPAGK